MTIPTSADSSHEWGQLGAEAKRARVLHYASELFAREGLAFPMPELARAIGIGVGSLYRQFEKKDDVIAALVLRRAETLTLRFATAADAADPWAALQRSVLETVDDSLTDRVAQEAWGITEGRPDVEAARAQVTAELDRLVLRAKEQGAVRGDLTSVDIGLLCKSARSAEELSAGGARRLAALVFAGMARA